MSVNSTDMHRMWNSLSITMVELWQCHCHSPQTKVKIGLHSKV